MTFCFRDRHPKLVCCAHLYKVRAHAFERVSVLCGSRCGWKSWRDSDRDAALRITHLSFCDREQGTVRSGIRTHVRGVWTRCFTTWLSFNCGGCLFSGKARFKAGTKGEPAQSACCTRLSTHKTQFQNSYGSRTRDFPVRNRALSLRANGFSRVAACVFHFKMPVRHCHWHRLPKQPTLPCRGRMARIKPQVCCGHLYSFMTHRSHRSQ